MKRLAFAAALLGGVYAMPCLAVAQSKTGGQQTSDGQQLQEVIVTASRRAENIQRSALAIQAVSGRELSQRGIYRAEDLSTLTPGVTFGTGANYPLFYVRGVGNFATNSLNEAAIAANVDGVYVSRPWQLRGSFFDLDRVEILKGPQGTLYGRNASGGAINIISVRPRIDGGYSGFAEAEVGNYDLYRAVAAVNLPISDVLAARIAGQVIHRDGYMSGGGDDDKGEAARVQILYQPSDKLSVLLHAAYQHQGGVGSAAGVTSPKVSSNPWAQNNIPAAAAIYAASPGLAIPDGTSFLNMHTYEVSGEIKWNFGPATLTVIPAYRGGSFHDSNWSSGFRLRDSEIEHQTSVEARLSNDSGPLKWVLGGYYFNERQSPYAGNDDIDVDVFQGPPVSSVTGFLALNTSYAAFGQAAYSITDRLRLTAGVRYTDEKRSINEVLDAGGFPIALQADEKSFRNVSWKAGAEYDLAPHSLAYFNASTGFKSGGFFAAPAPYDVFKPEDLLAFEAGVKNRFLGDTLQVNVEGFYWKYKNQQTPVFAILPNNFFADETINAGQSHMYGADIDVAYRVTAHDTIRTQVEYVQTRYDSFVLPVSFLTVSGCPITAAGLDCSGEPLMRTPTWNGTAGYTHTFDLDSRGTLDAAIDTQFASGSWLATDYLPHEWQPPYSIWDASLTYGTPDRKIALTAYVRNFTNAAVADQIHRHDFLFGSSVPFVGNPLAGPSGVFNTVLRPPRTYGVTLHLNF